MPLILAVLVFFVLVFVIDSLIALFAMWISQFTGLAAIQGLDFWNWFAIVILVGVLTATPAAAASRS